MHRTADIGGCIRALYTYLRKNGLLLQHKKGRGTRNSFVSHKLDLGPGSDLDEEQMHGWLRIMSRADEVELIVQHIGRQMPFLRHTHDDVCQLRAKAEPH